LNHQSHDEVYAWPATHMWTTRTFFAHCKDGDTDVVTQMQRSLDLWAGGLAATGGQLEPTKTFWYNIQFLWRDGTWRYGSKTDFPASITMQNTDGTRSVLEQVEVREGRRTLGVRLAPDGNNQSEFLYLQDQCNEWADKIRSGMLPKRYTWQAFTTTILAKLAYALPATTFSKKECAAITRRLIFTTLSKAGVNAHIPRDLVYGSTLRQGLGYPDLFVWQGAHAISRLVSFSLSHIGITKELLNISYETLCLESGFKFPLEMEYSRYGKLSTNCYLHALWEFAEVFNIRIRGPANPAVSSCKDDELLMELMCKTLEEAKLIQFNRCRIYLRVLWLSDITTADGKFIDYYATRAEINPTRSTRWNWPRQGIPSKKAWECWQKGLSSLGVNDIYVHAYSHWLGKITTSR
jgi:hypothetical protein